MSHEVKLHNAQTAILRELLFRQEASFAQLLKPTGLPSDHFTFHVNRLMELGLVERLEQGRYRLSIMGKEYANRLDTDNNTVERQPKSAVLLVIEREHEGKTEYVFQERLKQPYYGFWGRPTGKIRWGETIVQSAARELMEETGLVAEYKILGVYHEQVVMEGTSQLLEDKLFFYVHCTSVHGKLKAQFEGGRNAWMSLDEAKRQSKQFGNFEIGLRILRGEETFIEGQREVAPESF